MIFRSSWRSLSVQEPLIDLETQLHCLKPTWILTGVSILKFSLDGALNVKQYDLNAPVKYFKRSELQQAKDFYIDKSVPGKTPIALLFNIGSITSRCIFISLMMYYIKERCWAHDSCYMTHVTWVYQFLWNSHKLELSLTLKGPYYFDYVCMPFSIDGITNSCDWISVKVCFRRNWSPVKKEKSKSTLGCLVFLVVISNGAYRLA